MSFGKAPSKAAPQTATPSVIQTRNRSASSQIESLLENRGVAPIAAKAISIGKEIGKGRFKRVHQGLLRQRCGQERLEVVVLWYAKKDSEVRELDIIALLSQHAHSSSFVPEVFGVVDEKKEVTLVQERAMWGTLKSCLALPEGSVQMTIAHKLNAATQIAQALRFLESVHIVHADMACRNVLLFALEQDPRKVVAKVTDFGLAVVLKDAQQHEILKQPQATRWCSPETVAYGKLSHQSDVWSFGMLLWELFSGGATPWSRYDKRVDVTEKLTHFAEMGDSVSADLSRDFPIFEEASASSAYDLMLSCLRVNEDARPKMEELEESLVRLFEEEACTLVADESFATGAEVSALVDADEVLDDAASSGGSTEASLPCVRPPSPSKSEKSADVNKTRPARFEVVSSFLCSPDAAKILGPGKVQEMQRELEAASQTSSMNLTSAFESVDNVSHSLSDSAPIRELRLPRAASVGPLRCWGSAPALCIWTLWSLADDDALVRRDYVSEDAARMAFDADRRSLSLEKQELCQRSYFR